MGGPSVPPCGMAVAGPTRVSIVALPEAMPSTLMGLYDVLSSAGSMPTLDPPIVPEPFSVEIVAARRGTMELATGIPLDVRRSVDQVPSTDIVLVPSLLAPGGEWSSGRHPEVTDWIARMGEGGALLRTEGKQGGRGAGVIGGGGEEGRIPLISTTPRDAAVFLAQLREHSAAPGHPVKDVVINLGSQPFVMSIDDLIRFVGL